MSDVHISEALPAAMYAATIWVEGQSRGPIEALRIQWDNQVADVGPHMTVVYPQAVQDAGSIGVRARELIGTCPPFEVVLDRYANLEALERMDPSGAAWLRTAFPAFRNPIVLLPVSGASAVLDLRRRLDAIFRQPRAALASPPFVTISQGLDYDAAAKVMRDLADVRPNFSFEVRAVDILAMDESGGFASDALPLEG
jgi:hypothetical protein